MSTIRLTQDHRRDIVSRLLYEKFHAQEQSIKDRFKKLADDTIDELIGPAKDLMSTIPEGWLPKVESLYVSYAGMTHYFESDRVVPNFVIDADNRTAFDASHPLTIEFMAINDLNDKIVEEKNKAKVLAKAMLSRFTTVKKLIEVWPEVEPYVFGKKDEAAIEHLPVVQTSQLNAVFGLPKEKSDDSAPHS